MTKQCSCCKATQPASAYGPHATNKDSLQNYCRTCMRAKARERDRRPFYKAWRNIKDRISNPKHPNFRWYGALGVTMLPAWRDDYEAFAGWLLAHLGPRPKGMSLDRIDPWGDYVPGNLRWATPAMQTRNRRRSIPLRQAA